MISKALGNRIYLLPFSMDKVKSETKSKIKSKTKSKTKSKGKIMNKTYFNEFTEQLKRKLLAQMGAKIKIDIHETSKNNGVTYYALAVLKEGCNVSPNIRLDDFYHAYMEGMSIAEIAEEVIKILEGGNGTPCLDLRFFTDFEKAKDHILFKVVSYELNKKRLREIPHIKFLDLAVTFYYGIRLEKISGDNASIQIERSHLELWNIDEGMLFDLAMENTVRKMPARCATICEVILSIMKENNIIPKEGSVEKFKREADEVPLYVLSNDKNYFGASVIYYPGVLQKIAKKLGCDLIILPSSIHEVILMPATDKKRLEDLNEMITDINADHVTREEVLSNHWYYFDLERNEIRMPPA